MLTHEGTAPPPLPPSLRTLLCLGPRVLQLQEAFLRFLASPSPPSPEDTEFSLLQGARWQKRALLSVQAGPQRALCILTLPESLLGKGEGEEGPLGMLWVPPESEDSPPASQRFK